MKTFITTLSLTLAISSCCFAQKSNQTKDTPSFGKSPDYLKKIDTVPVIKHGPSVSVVPAKFTKTKLNKDTSAFAASPLYVIKDASTNKMTPTLAALGFIKQGDIASLAILKDKEAELLFSKQPTNGVIVIGLIPSAKVYTIGQYLDHNNIAKKDQKLPIYLDYNLLPNLKDMVITQGNTKTVTIETEDNGKKYISIKTTDYPINVPDRVPKTK